MLLCINGYIRSSTPRPPKKKKTVRLEKKEKEKRGKKKWEKLN
jgi:hypothetical protein